jgi:NTP pyrophosphatase (non-canonical NTP hydrolase)
MKFNEYQVQTKTTAIYPEDKGLIYTALGLCSEAGEVADKIKKSIRDKGGDLDEADLLGLKKELGDVLWYVACLSSELGFSLQDVAEGNLDKLRSRADRDQLGGSGDDR